MQLEACAFCCDNILQLQISICMFRRSPIMETHTYWHSPSLTLFWNCVELQLCCDGLGRCSQWHSVWFCRVTQEGTKMSTHIASIVNKRTVWWLRFQSLKIKAPNGGGYKVREKTLCCQRSDICSTRKCTSCVHIIGSPGQHGSAPKDTCLLFILKRHGRLC